MPIFLFHAYFSAKKHQPIIPAWVERVFNSLNFVSTPITINLRICICIYQQPPVFYNRPQRKTSLLQN